MKVKNCTFHYMLYECVPFSRALAAGLRNEGLVIKESRSDRVRGKNYSNSDPVRGETLLPNPPRGVRTPLSLPYSE